MTLDSDAANPFPWRRRIAITGLFGAALGIAAAILVSNGAPSATCAAQPDTAAAIGRAAVGELAALNATATGRSYADLGFQDASGKTITLADLDATPKLVNFWATWCVPCRAEMPALAALAKDYQGKAFAVVPVNLDLGAEGVEKAAAFLKSEGLDDLPLYADPTYAAFEKLKANAVALGLPATLLLDAKGCELAVLQGPAEWNSPDGHAVIDALLAPAQS